MMMVMMIDGSSPPIDDFFGICIRILRRPVLRYDAKSKQDIKKNKNKKKRCKHDSSRSV
jgi:hypothetical protein